MNDPRPTESCEDDVGDVLASLLDATPDRERQERALVVVREHWRWSLARRRARRRTLLAAAAGVAIAVAAALLLVRSPRQDWGTVILARGGVEVNGRPAAAGEHVAAGRLTTGTDSALVLSADGASVRIGADSAVDLAGPDRLRLEQGRVYVDRPPHARGAFRVVTPLGTVHELGTQFAVALDERLTVSVREGAVIVEAGASPERVDAGWRLVRERAGQVDRRPVSTYGAAWTWAEQLAPRRELNGLTVAAVAAWVARETGRSVQFADPGVARLAHTTVVRSGTFAVGPEAALAAVLPTAGLEAIEEPGLLRIRRR